MKKCPFCSRMYDDSQSFCLDDGTALITNAAFHSTPTEVIRSANLEIKPRKTSKILPIFTGTVALLAIGIIAAWFFLQRNYGEPDHPRAIASNAQATPVPVQSAATPSTPTPGPSPLPTDLPPTNVNLPVNSDTVSTSKPIEVSDPTTLPPIMKTEDHSVSFNLHQCRKSGSSITCDFTFMNKGPDRKFEFVIDRSNLFDELGNTYNGRSGRLANNEGSEPQIIFVSGVTTKAQITFEGVQPNASKITLLRIQYDLGNDYGLEIKFRNVPMLIPK